MLLTIKPEIPKTLMLINSETAELAPELNADVCIVGGGAAGISLALEFLNSSTSVCLIESGSTQFDASTQALYEGRNVGLPYYPLEVSRLRYLGGTTNHWTGWCRPFDPIDFQKREFIPNSGWPINRESLDPYYEKAHVLCELGDFFYETEHPAPSEHLRALLWKRSPPTRFGERYKDDLAQSSNITVYMNANVTNIETNDAGDRVNQLHINTLGGKAFRVRAKSYVLCTGGIEVPRLLLASNTRNPKGIGNDHDLVGRYFMLHPQLEIGTLYADPVQKREIVQAKHRDGMSTANQLRGGFSLPPEVQRQHSLPNHAVLPHSANTSRKDQWVRIFKRTVGLLKDSPDSPQGIRTLMREFGSASVDLQPIRLQLRMDHQPNPDSRVYLGEERDALGMPRPVLDWHTTSADFDGVRKTAELLAAYIGELGLGRVQLDDWLYANEQIWPDDTAWDFHHLGTTRMSADPQTGVVDENCRVHGIANLYISSSSVFATASFANPTLTIVALTIRLADRLKKELSQ